MALIKWIYGSDNHGDMVCEEAVAKFLKFTEEWKPKHKIHGGDGMDLRSYRKGAGAEEREEGIQRDIQAHLLFMEQYRPHVFIEGNHDHRLREMAEHGSEEKRSTEAAVALQEKLDEFYRKKIKCKVVRYGQERDWWQAPEGGHKFVHGKHHGTHIARAHHDTYEGPTVCGHGHRPDIYQGAGGTSIASPALCRIWDQRYDAHQPGKKKQRNGWVFGVINSKTGRSEGWIVKKEEGVWISPMGEL